MKTRRLTFSPKPKKATVRFAERGPAIIDQLIQRRLLTRGVPQPAPKGNRP